MTAERGRGRGTMLVYPRGRLLGVIDDPARAAGAARALVEAGFAEADVEILVGEDGRARLSTLGSKPVRLPRVVRAVQFLLMDQLPDFLVYERSLEDGRAVIAVRAADRARVGRAKAVIDRAGGHFLNYFGRFTTEELSMWRGPEPEIRDALRR